MAVASQAPMSVLWQAPGVQQSTYWIRPPESLLHEIKTVRLSRQPIYELLRWRYVLLDFIIDRLQRMYHMVLPLAQTLYFGPRTHKMRSIYWHQ